MKNGFTEIINCTKKVIKKNRILSATKLLGNKMEVHLPSKWCYKVETSDGLLSFKLSRTANNNNYVPLAKVLNDKHRFMKCVFPSADEYTCKHPDFAYEYMMLKKNLKQSGYKTMWTLHAIYGVEGNDSSVQPEVEHTIGRKRKRQPTFKLGDDEEDTKTSNITPYKQGLLLAIPENNPDSRCEIIKIVESHKFRVDLEIECVNTDDHWVTGEGRDILHVTSGQQNEADYQVHPAFINTSGNHMFHSMDEVESVLDKCPDKPGIIDLKRCFKQIDKACTKDCDLKNPFIVIEGLDGTGKSTLTEELVNRLKATQLQTPPKCLHSNRPIFDSYPALIRRIYYSVGNYVVAEHIVKECETKPVIMDRFWHSTAAYTIATECSGGASSIPPLNHWVYTWPDDLPQPTVVILLTVSEEVRAERIGSRVDKTGLQKTEEENRMDQNIMFRQRIQAAYKRMKEPSVIEVNADGSPQQVLESVINVLSQHGISN